EDKNDTARRKGTDRLQYVFQSFRLMRVVNVDLRALWRRTCKFQTAGRALYVLESLEGKRRIEPGRNGEASGDQRVAQLELTCERQVNLVDPAIMFDFAVLAVTLVLGTLDGNESSVAANGEQLPARLAY